MPFRFRFFALFVAALACAAGARAQEYGSVVVFGDSLSDAGNVAQAQGLPSGTAFTTNPDPVWAEIVAQTFGAPGTHSLAGGSNYAFGGACVDPAASCNYPTPRIGDQIGLHLSRRPAAAADPAALYAVWGGVNDIDTILNPDDGLPPVDPRTAVPQAARAMVDQIRRLQEAGARHIAVFNLPDPGATPFAGAAAAARGDPLLPDALTGLATLYNRHLEDGLRSLGTGIVPVNVFALFEEAIENPAAYGFTNTRGTACSPVGPDRNSLACGPLGSGSPLTYEPGANRTHLFADLRHPGGAAHAMVASVVVSTLEAPVQVSLAGEAGVAAMSSHRRAVANERISEWERPVGSWRVYSAAQTGREAVDAVPRLGEARADVLAMTLGASHRAADRLWWGAALSLGRHENGVAGADLKGDTIVASLHGTWRRGGAQLTGALNLGRSRVDVERSVSLGPTNRRERGSTAAGLIGADIDLRWTVSQTGSVRHGPALGVSWLGQAMDGFREEGKSSTAMNFSGFDRDSLVLRGGYRVSGAADVAGAVVRPYAAIGFEREFEDDAISVTAGSNTTAGRFAASGFAPPRQWLSADIGASASLNGKIGVVLGYSGRYGDDSLADHLLNVGLRIAF